MKIITTVLGRLDSRAVELARVPVRGDLLSRAGDVYTVEAVVLMPEAADGTVALALLRPDASSPDAEVDPQSIADLLSEAAGWLGSQPGSV